MFIYTDRNNEVIIISEKDILAKGNYINKYEVPDDIQPPKNLHLYIFDGSKFILKPDAFNVVKQSKRKELLNLEKQRVQNILNQYDYISLSDIQLYVSQNDKEAQTILDWFMLYDNLIWNWIDNDLQNYQTINDLLDLDMQQIEEEIYQNSIVTNPLP